MVVNNVYFCWKEYATLQFSEVRECRICGKKASEFLPGGLRQNVGEIELGELCAAHS